MKVYRINGYGWHNTYIQEADYQTAIKAINDDPFENVESTQILERIELPTIREQRIRNEDFEDPTPDILDVRELASAHIANVKQESDRFLYVLPDQVQPILALLRDQGIEAVL